MVGSAAPGTPLADGGSSAGRRDRDRSAGLCRVRGIGGPVAKGGRVRGGGLYGIPVRMKLNVCLGWDDEAASGRAEDAKLGWLRPRLPLDSPQAVRWTVST